MNSDLQQMYSSKRSQLLEQSLIVLEKELKWRQENERCGFYEPNEPCKKFIDLVGSQRDMVCILSTSNGLGKTTLVANLLANLIFGPQNKTFDYPIFRNWPYPKRIRFITDPKLTEQIGPLHSEIIKWWPKGQYEAEKAGKNYFSQYKANGWILDVMSYDQDPKQFEGGTLGMVIFDEPPPETLYNACISRLRLGGFLLVTMTPLTQAAWLFDKVVPNHQDSIVYGKMEDACKEHGVNGHLEHSFIEKMIKEMPKDEVDARVYGKALYLQGLVYKTFDYNVHVTKKPIPVNHNHQVWQIVDPAVDKPFASIWGYPTADGSFYQIAEWPNEDFYSMHRCDLGIKDYKRIFDNMEQGWTVTKRIIDRHFADVRSLQTNRTLRDDFRDIGLNYEPSYTANEEIESGILTVRSFLKYDTSKPIDSINRPRYFVDSKCVNTIKGFQRWAFDPKTGKPRDEYKDFCDCVRYALVAQPKLSYTPPQQTYKRLYG